MQDVLGRSFDFREPPRRVVSLVPSLTETLFAVGAGESVIAITDFCIFPPGLTLPRVGGTKNPRIDEIRALRPDLVYMNLEENLERHARAIEELTPVFVTEPRTLDDVALLFQQLGAIHDRHEEASALASVLRDELQAAQAGPFTFAVPIWKDPWMWCGGDTYVSHLVEAVGGRNVLRDLPRYPRLEPHEVLARTPGVVFLPDEPYVFTDADAAALDVRTIGPFPGHLFTWHGSRTIEGLRFLRMALS